MYINSVTIVGFVGADPEHRRSRSNGANFTILSVATRRSWKNRQDKWSSKTEWHRVCVFRPRLAEYVAQTIKKGSHVLIGGSLISSPHERPNGKDTKVTTATITSWSIRADVVRKLDRCEPEPEAVPSDSHASDQTPEASNAAPF
jgi:single-strand DNA-binding protein